MTSETILYQMLRPTKYTNPNISILAISAELLKLGKSTNSYSYPDLLDKVVARKGIEAKSMFLPALNFLFLVGKVQYEQKGDIITFSNENI